MNPETRYARHGDDHIAYQIVGDGPIDMVFMSKYWPRSGPESAFLWQPTTGEVFHCQKNGGGASRSVGPRPASAKLLQSNLTGDSFDRPT